MPAGSDGLSWLELLPRAHAVTARTLRPCSMIGDAADHLACAVEIGDAAPQVVADLQVPDVFQLHRLAVLVAAEDEQLQLVDVVGVRRRRAAGTRGWSTSIVRPPAS